MPYIGRTPTGVGSVSEIDGDLTVTGNIKSGGQLTANDTLFKMIMDTAADLGDNFLIEDGGTDGSGTNAGDDICLEKDLQVIPAGDIISISGVAGAAASAGYEFVSSVTASSSATVEFTTMTTGYDYLLVAHNCKNAADNVDIKVELGITGPTYRTSGYRSGNGFHYVASSYGSSANITADIRLTGAPVGNVDPERYDFALNIIDPANSGSNTTTFGLINWFNTSNGQMVGQSYGIYTSNEAHTALKFSTSSGNITSGIFKLYKRPSA
mgnify:FL=1